ncbi:hypothetical protein FDP41_012679 [Naegleria fowleri]|uniref:Uncharacterized protein n=1 Tax=Naegleria fowleri TaxID=5763 RepID=A0A6A5C1L4_NAEFO|nr:uncharacterized protein FDP41_012679 [Naegleria fowleri]KAF0980891.1 hypothetical protein FDP41_012679 [Naegleria fowleri]CAG4717216.1 unnamed protein product [Naegleria fowleri]
MSREIRPTDFDNKFLHQIKLKDLPKFLIQHANWNGVFRINAFLTRHIPPMLYNPTRWRLPLLFVVFLGWPGIYRANTSANRTSEALINARFGDEINNMTDYQKNYIKTRVLKIMAENR